MRLLPIAASIVLAAVPSWGATSHHQKKTSQASKTSRATHSVLASRRAKEPQASLRAAKFSPAEGDTPQSGSSTGSASSKKKLRKKKHTTTAHHRTPSQMAPTPDRINDIQSALARGGYYRGDPNGKMDADTVDAVQRFQSANGLDTTGKLDALTLQKLGLGSDIAGVSSPKGITPHSCCSMSPSPSMAPRPSAAPSGPPMASVEAPKQAASTASSSSPSSVPTVSQSDATSH
jgi:peptidoglycan hydrolase-like protein with peptidoglycan-binding domain